MDHRKDKTLKPFVIVISGFVGSGKSTVATKLSELLGNAPVLTFDAYEADVQWPQDMSKWMADGADPSGIRVPRMKADVLSLLKFTAINHPLDGRILKPGKYIIVEEPSGREREEIRELVDLVVFIDVPEDICVVRMIQRVLDMETWSVKGTFANASRENLVHQLDAVASWVTQYNQARPMYWEVSKRVRHNVDVIVDGTKSVDYITTQIMNAIQYS